MCSSRRLFIVPPILHVKSIGVEKFRKIGAKGAMSFNTTWASSILKFKSVLSQNCFSVFVFDKSMSVFRILRCEFARLSRKLDNVALSSFPCNLNANFDNEKPDFSSKLMRLTLMFIESFRKAFSDTVDTTLSKRIWFLSKVPGSLYGSDKIS